MDSKVLIEQLIKLQVDQGIVVIVLLKKNYWLWSHFKINIYYFAGAGGASIA